MRIDRTSFFSALLAGVTAVFLIGCGPPGLKLNPVSGTVTFDGEPLPEGRIQFRAVEGDQRAFSGKIEQGPARFHSRQGRGKTVARVVHRFDRTPPGEPQNPEDMERVFTVQKMTSNAREVSGEQQPLHRNSTLRSVSGLRSCCCAIAR